MLETFYLGTHETSWLGRTATPLFISRIRLARRRNWPRALGTWALDSGGYSELHSQGRWRITPEQYVDEVRTWREAIGGMDWCAPMDWHSRRAWPHRPGCRRSQLRCRSHRQLRVPQHRVP